MYVLKIDLKTDEEIENMTEEELDEYTLYLARMEARKIEISDIALPKTAHVELWTNRMVEYPDPFYDSYPKNTKDKPICERIQIFLTFVILRLLTTTKTLEEISFVLSPQYFSLALILFFGVAKRAFYLALLAYFFQDGYIGARSVPFIALDLTSGECTTIAAGSTGNYYADYYGNWQSSALFRPNLSTYVFTIFDFFEDEAGYLKWIKNVEFQIQLMGKRAMTQDLSINLLYWVSWTYDLPTIGSAGTLSDQYITLIGNPKSIMDKGSVVGTFSSYSFDCPTNFAAVSYDASAAVLTMSMSTKDLFASPQCKDLIQPSNLGWSESIGDHFSIQLDVRPLFSALSVVFYINGPNTLRLYTKIRHITTSYHLGILYEVSDYYDPNYPGG